MDTSAELHIGTSPADSTLSPIALLTADLQALVGRLEEDWLERETIKNGAAEELRALRLRAEQLF